MTQWLELLGGTQPLPDAVHTGTGRLALGLWWALLLLAVFAFVGRGAKFIYVDF